MRNNEDTNQETFENHTVFSTDEPEQSMDFTSPTLNTPLETRALHYVGPFKTISEVFHI